MIRALQMQHSSSGGGGWAQWRRRSGAPWGSNPYSCAGSCSRLTVCCGPGLPGSWLWPTKVEVSVCLLWMPMAAVQGTDSSQVCCFEGESKAVPDKENFLQTSTSPHLSFRLPVLCNNVGTWQGQGGWRREEEVHQVRPAGCLRPLLPPCFARCSLGKRLTRGGQGGDEATQPLERRSGARHASGCLLPLPDAGAK